MATIDNAVTVIAKMNNCYVGLRPMQQRDYSCIHIDPVPEWCPRRILYKGETMAIVPFTQQIDAEDSERFEMSNEQLVKLNTNIATQLHLKGK